MTGNSTPLVKMCGMTREADAVQAINLGADAIGMLFYANSPRYVSIGQGAAIARAVSDGSLKVGLFVDAERAFVEDVLAAVPLDILQFHGSEDPAYCASFGLPYWKTVRVKEAAGLPGQIARYPQAAGILLDTWHPDKAGGTGETFDWAFLDGLDMHQHLILAGGLQPENIRAAVSRVKPWAVDVCSGVEASPGIKSGKRMQLFIEEAKKGVRGV